MVDTPTPRLRLLPPTVGGDYNTWGNTLNSDLSVLDDAITGQLSIDVSGLTSLTLSTANGATDQARFALVAFTGSNSATTTCDVTLPANQKLYWVKNTCTNTTIVLTCGSGNTATIAPSSLYFKVLCDGTNVSVMPLASPSVTDWSSNQLVPAKDADGRYVASTVGGTSAGTVRQLTYNTGLGQISAQTGDGTWHFAQPAGDYATNSALKAETSRAEAAESSLQSSKANLEGGNTWSGHQELAGDLQIDNQANSSVAGSYNDGVVTNVLANRFGYKSVCGVREVVGQSLQAMISVYNGETWSEFDFHHSSSGGRIITPNGTVALTSDLPISSDQRIMSWTATASYGDRVNFPTGFSGNPTTIQITSTTDNGRPVLCSWESPDSGGFTIIPRRVDQDGSSNADAGITYAFLAIGPK